ncbi:MAG: N-acetylneuraminate synthase family protein [Bacteroidota bacterium]|nr:N-acetylneuraminate synthase family protein [Bacteroidota bacterium]
MNYYNIIEVANTHGGDLNYMLSLIEEFEFLGEKENCGIKFQAFSPDGIALKDFEYYSVYETLFFKEEDWKKIITKASLTKQVWLDIFDIYGIEILTRNRENIIGIKLQTSVLENQEVLNNLINLKINDKKLIINIAGRAEEEIRFFVNYFEENVKPKELLLEVGFQSYPTQFEDSGLSKIQYLKDRFNKRIVFADHLDGTDENAINIPLYAMIAGADIIEKHVMHSELETKFDKFSSITIKQFNKIIEQQKVVSNSFNQSFINVRELEYFHKSNQIPVSIKNISKDSLFTSDLISFRRTSQKGLYFSDLKNKLNNRYFFSHDINAGSTFCESDLKKIKIATIIAARLKSSRLKEKAKLKIGELSSIELCIKNALNFKDVDYTILATSNLKQDAELENYTFDKKKVVFHKGDPDDVIQRYLDIVRKLDIDVVIRVTGDNAFICSELAEFLIKSHLESGSDYTVGVGAPIGTNLEIINSKALEKVKTHFTRADYSEYMSWYFTNNAEHFKLNFVDLPKKWKRDYRLTLDYQEDLEMYNIILKYFETNHVKFTLENLINYLDNNPSVASINAHIGLKFKTDQELIDTLNRVTKINK